MKKYLVLLLGVAMLFTVAACGRDDDEEQEHSQGVTDTTIYIGNTAVTSGGAGFVGQPFIAAMEAYLNMINEDGGVFGRDIELVHRDDGFDGDQGEINTWRLIDEDEVFALVGHFGTPTVSTTIDDLNEHGILRVYYGTGTTTVRNANATSATERTSFPVQPLYEVEGELMVKRAIATLGAERIGLFETTNDDVGREIRAGMERAATEHGVELVVYQEVGFDFNTPATALVAADVDVIIVGGNQFMVPGAILALDEAGNEAPVMVSYVAADASVVAQVAAVLDNFDVYANAWVNLFDEHDDFSDEYQLFRDTMATVQDGAYVENNFAVAGWIAAMIFVEGLKRMDPNEAITWENYVNAMESDLFEYGMGSPIDYRDGQRLGTQTLSLLQMRFEDEIPYLELVEPFEHIDDILAD